MGLNLGLVPGIAAGLLVAAGVIAAGLALAYSLLSPLPAKPPEAKEEAAEPEDEAVLASRKAAYLRGLYVLMGLAVLTAAEFAVATCSMDL